MWRGGAFLASFCLSPCNLLKHRTITVKSTIEPPCPPCQGAFAFDLPKMRIRLAAGGRWVSQTPVAERLTLTNNTDRRLGGLWVQNCVLLQGLVGFDEPSGIRHATGPPYIARGTADGGRWVITAWWPGGLTWATRKTPACTRTPSCPTAPRARAGRRTDGFPSTGARTSAGRSPASNEPGGARTAGKRFPPGRGRRRHPTADRGSPAAAAAGGGRATAGEAKTPPVRLFENTVTVRNPTNHPTTENSARRRPQPIVVFSLCPLW